MKHQLKWSTTTLCISVAMICLGLAIAGAELVDRILVMVNDDIILKSDLDQVMSPLEASLDKQGYSKAEQHRILRNQRGKVLEQLIYDKLTDQQVRQHNLNVKDAAVDATIARIRSANKLTEDELHRALELDGMTYEAYRTQIKEKMLRAQLVNREVKSKIVITDADIKSYYDTHSEQYAGSVKYDLRHILLRVPGDAAPTEKTRVLEQMEVVRDRLLSGESFAKMAGQFSDAPTASQGGKLGVFGSHLLTEEIRSALKGTRVNEFTQTVETDQGYQIFYVEDIISTGGKSLEDASLEIRKKLFDDIVDQKFNTWIEDLRKRSHIQILDE
jgi:peptidyl-prolyl cis-trans isomerase SurA